MENQQQVVHGLYATYTNLSCRCDLCRASAAEYMRSYRKTNSGKVNARRWQALANERGKLAIQWMKDNNPSEWEEIVKKAHESVKKEKQ